MEFFIKVTDVEQFFIKEQDYYYFQSNFLFKNNILYYEFNYDYSTFEIFKNEKEIYVENQITKIVDGVNKEFIINHSIVLESFNGEYSIFIVDRNIRKREFKRSYFNVLTGEKLADLTHYDSLGKTLFEDKYFILNTKNENTVKNISYYNELLWQKEYQYPDYFDPGHERMTPTKLEKFLGIYENELWILFSNNRLLVLDTETGEEIHHIPNLVEELEVLGLDLSHLHFDKPNKKLKALAGRYYIEIDLITKKGAVKKDFKTSESGLAIMFSKFYEGDKNLYFICRPPDNKTRWKTVAGIFDTETLSVTWSDELIQEEAMHFFVNTPQANDQYFGVQDNKNNLYLFERNKLESNVLAPYL